MFKKSLLATALLTAGAAQAAVVTTDYTGNGLTNDTNGVFASTQYAVESGAAGEVTVSIALDAAYSAGDIITLTIGGGSIDTADTSILNAITATANAAADTIALGLLSKEDGKLTYRVTSAAGDTDLLSIDVVIPLEKDHMTNATGVSVSYAAETSTGIAIDVAKTNTATLVSFFDQYSIKASTKAAAKVDVAQEREAFEDLDTGVGVDFKEDIVLSVSDVQVGDDVNPSTTVTNLADLIATTVKAKYTVSGDFSWMTTTDDGDLDTGESEITVSNSGTATVGAVAFDTSGNLTFTVTGADQTGDLTLNFDVPQDEFKIPVQDLAVTQVLTHTTDVTETVADLAAGSWTLNGANVHVPYMPYGSTISQIIYVTNEATAGDVSVVVTAEDGTVYDLGVVATAGTGVTGLAGVIKAGLPEDFSGKAAMDITVNAPDAKVTVYAAYNVGGSDRGTINTSQYKK